MPNNRMFYTISEQIMHQIKSDIFNGKLKEGENLREVQLANKYKVSRGPVRDALKALAKEGFLVAKPNVGVKVASPPSNEVLKEIIAMRKQLEIFAMREVIDKFTNEDISKFESVMEQMKKACQNGDIQDFLNLDVYFHSLVIKKYNDKHLYGIWNELILRMMFNYKRLENLQESCTEHENILEAIKSGDLDEVIKYITNNIQ